MNYLKQKQIDKSNYLIKLKDVYIDISNDGDDIIISYKNIKTKNYNQTNSPTDPSGHLRILSYNKWIKDFYYDHDYNMEYGKNLFFDDIDEEDEIKNLIIKRKDIYKIHNEKQKKYHDEEEYHDIDDEEKEYKSYRPPCKAKNREIYCAYYMKATHGWGPLLFEVGLEWATLNNTYIINDRRDVSKEARVMMKKFNSRSDIEKVQLDDLDNTLTDINDDNCWQYSYGDGNDLRQDERSKAYRKFAPLNLILNLFANNRIDIHVGKHNKNYRMNWNKLKLEEEYQEDNW